MKIIKNNYRFPKGHKVEVEDDNVADLFNLCG